MNGCILSSEQLGKSRLTGFSLHILKHLDSQCHSTGLPGLSAGLCKGSIDHSLFYIESTLVSIICFPKDVIRCPCLPYPASLWRSNKVICVRRYGKNSTDAMALHSLHVCMRVDASTHELNVNVEPRGRVIHLDLWARVSHLSESHQSLIKLQRFWFSHPNTMILSAHHCTWPFHRDLGPKQRSSWLRKMSFPSWSVFTHPHYTFIYLFLLYSFLSSVSSPS